MRTARGHGLGAGRHRPGATRVPWTRIPWDVRQRAAAAGLDLIEPRWLVIYRVWARKFYAVPVGPLPSLREVEAQTVVGLQARMRQAESGSPVTDEHVRTSRDEVRAP